MQQLLRTHFGSRRRYRRVVLTEVDLEEIRQGLRDGLRGPILLKWYQQLLAERDELVARLRVLDAAKRTQEQLKQA